MTRKSLNRQNRAPSLRQQQRAAFNDMLARAEVFKPSGVNAAVRQAFRPQNRGRR